MAVMVVVSGRLQNCGFGIVVEVRQGGSVTNGANLPSFLYFGHSIKYFEEKKHYNLTLPTYYGKW